MPWECRLTFHKDQLAEGDQSDLKKLHALWEVEQHLDK